jgi:LCP family protein required for cell wall assembly
MAQAPAPNSPRSRRRSSRSEGRQERSARRVDASVPELLARRQKTPPAPQRRPWRSALLPFALGLSLGYGLSTPALRQVPSLLAGLIHAPRSIASIVNPMASGNRRVLVLGRDKVGDNTDVMFTVQVKDGITLVTQVPRDTYVETDQLGTIKANALFALGGVDAAKDEVAKLIGAPVQRYFKLNLDAVAKVADALGGVEVDVPQRMYYVDNAQGLYIDLAPGRQVLRGEALEGFLRFRHDELGDLGRMERQRLVMAKVFGKLAQPSTLTRLPELLKIAGDDVLTDLSPLEMTQLVTAMAQTKLSSQRLPGRLYWQNDLSYWMPDTNTQHPAGSGDEPTN